MLEDPDSDELALADIDPPVLASLVVSSSLLPSSPQPGTHAIIHVTTTIHRPMRSILRQDCAGVEPTRERSLAPGLDAGCPSGVDASQRVAIAGAGDAPACGAP